MNNNSNSCSSGGFTLRDRTLKDALAGEDETHSILCFLMIGDIRSISLTGKYEILL